jgi:hypothetical protein
MGLAEAFESAPDSRETDWRFGLASLFSMALSEAIHFDMATRPAAPEAQPHRSTSSLISRRISIGCHPGNKIEADRYRSSCF